MSSTRITYAGTGYATIRLAALGYAAAVLPDLSVIGAEESPAAIARDLEAYYYSELVQAGDLELPTDDDEQPVNGALWRALCRGAIVARIVAHREDRRAAGIDVAEVQP